MKKYNNSKLPERIIKAIYKQDMEIITKWMNTETINATDKYGASAIIIAVLSDSEKVVRLLLEGKPDTNLRDKKGWCVMHYIAQNYQLNIAKIILDYGIEIDTEDNYGNTPLWRAVFSSQGNRGMITLLLSYGADRNHQNLSGISPVGLAENIANYDVTSIFTNRQIMS